jgi:LPXTG-motif cell wall-anchored protein
VNGSLNNDIRDLKMRRKLSFLSGLTAVIVFLFAFSTSTYAAVTTGTNTSVTNTDVQSSTYGDVSDSTYGDVAGSTYGDVAGSTYGDVPGSTYGDVPGSTYGDVPGSTYGDVPGSTYDDVPGSTYSDVSQTVYSDVYANVASSVSQAAANHSTEAQLNYSDQAGKNLEFGFDASQYAPLFADNNIQSVAVDKGDVKMSIPVSFLKGKDYLLFSVKKDNTSYANAIGPVYEFSINGGAISKFADTPITLTLKFDKSKVTNWNNVVVKYINPDGTISTEQIEIVKIDQNTGEITVKVKHFSKYGVFEVPNSSTTTGSTSGTTTPGTTTSTPTTSSTATTTGNALPNTATDSYNFLIAGFALVALGGILFSIRNRKAMN